MSEYDFPEGLRKGSPKQLDRYITEVFFRETAGYLTELLGKKISNTTAGITGRKDSEVDIVSIDDEKTTLNNYPIFLQRDSFDIAADYNNCEAALNMPYEEFLALLKIFTSTVKNGLPKKVWCLRTGIVIDKITRKIIISNHTLEFDDIAKALDVPLAEVRRGYEHVAKKFNKRFRYHEAFRDKIMIADTMYDAVNRPIDTKFLYIRNHKGAITTQKKEIDKLIQLIDKLKVVLCEPYIITKITGKYKELLAMQNELLAMQNEEIRKFINWYQKIMVIYGEVVTLMKDQEHLAENYDRIEWLMDNLTQQKNSAQILGEQIIATKNKVVTSIQTQEIEYWYDIFEKLHKKNSKFGEKLQQKIIFWLKKFFKIGISITL